MHIKKIESLTFADEQMTFTQTEDFSTYNVIYGLNGSGKSSISKLFNSFSKQSRERDNKQSRERDNNIDGSLILEDDNKLSTINKTNISHDNILVFNDDFIKPNIETNIKDNYIILGEASNLKKEIDIIDKKIQKKINCNTKLREKKQEALYKAIQESITDNTNLSKSKYDKNRPEVDYKTYKPDVSHKKESSEISTIKALLRNPKDDYEVYEEIQQTSIIDKFSELLSQLDEIINEEKLQNKPIDRLKNDLFLDAWVKEMYDKIIIEQKYSKEQCPFCNTTTISDGKVSNHISKLYEELDHYFNKEYNSFIIKFDSFLSTSDRFISTLDNLKNSEITKIHYSNFINKDDNKTFKDIKEMLESFYFQIELCTKAIKGLALIKKENVLKNNNKYETELLFIKKEYHSKLFDYKNKLDDINDIVKVHNEKLQKKLQNNNSEIEIIKNHFLFESFNKYRIYKKAENKFICIENKLLEEKTEKENLYTVEKNKFKQDHIDNINNSLSRINISLKINDINGHLTLYRNNKTIEIKKLSEGEKNLVIFTYFISLIDNYKTNKNSKNEPLIIFIDDPHSSLDKENLSLICTLINNRIKNTTEKEKFKKPINQIFISSHNYKFLININEECFKKHIFIQDMHYKNLKYFEITKTNSEIFLETTKNKWYNHSVDYIEMYNHIVSFYKTYNQSPVKAIEENFPKVNLGKFIEELVSYLLPSISFINIKTFSDKIGYQGNLHSDIRHYNDKEPSEVAKFNVDVIKLMKECNDEYIKQHFEHLDTAIESLHKKLPIE